MQKQLSEKLTGLLQQKIPFCVYKKPQSSTINLIVQKNENLYKLTGFNSSGFVFCPFNSLSGEPVILPIQHTNQYSFPVPENLSYKQNKQLTEHSLKEHNNHINLVNKTIDYIKSNNCPKIVISRKETIKATDFNIVKTFINLSLKYKDAMVYLWFHQKTGMWAGATPELLLQAKNNKFSTMALAGTQKTEKNKPVKWQEKEKSEQQYVTDYIIKKCKELNLKINTGKPFTVKAGNIAHIRTDITGVFKNKSDFNNLIKILHPTPAVCGIPFEKAKEFIIQNEGYNREYYTGFLGELNYPVLRNRNKRNIENQSYFFNNTKSELFVNLRCMKITNNTIDLFIGGGITKDSNAKNELNETIEKSKVLKNFII